MALGRQGEREADLMLSWAELPRSPGHAFYDRLQAVLIAAGFDGFAEKHCAPTYAGKRRRPSLPPGRYFRMHLVGYFEGIDSERGLEWRCATACPCAIPAARHHRAGARPLVAQQDPLAAAAGGARGRVRLGLRAPGRARPDRGTGSASTPPRGGRRRLRAIVRRETGEGDREMLKRLAEESGIATPTAEDLIRLDRERKGERLSNAAVGLADHPEASIAKLKDGRTHLAYKPRRSTSTPARSSRPRSIRPIRATPDLPGTPRRPRQPGGGRAPARRRATRAS